MFCEKCGKPNEGNPKFCEHCGAALNTTPAPVQQPVAQVPKASILDKIKQIHGKNKWIFPAIAAVIVVIVAVCVVVSVLSKQVNVSDYLKVEASGFEGYGELTYDFDEFSFAMRVIGEKDYKEYGDADSEDSDFIRKYERKLKKLEKLMNSIEVKAELPEGRTSKTLKNGDVVKVTVSMDEKQAKKHDITPKKMTYEYEVSGLKEIQKYDPLSNFDVVFEGYNGYGTYKLECTKTEEKDLGEIIFSTEEGNDYIQVRYKDDDYSDHIYVYVDSEKYDEFSNGDTVKLYIERDEDRWINDGVILSSVSKEVKASGLKEMQSVDLLSNVQVVFDGINGSGEAELAFTEQKITVGELTFDFESRDVYVGDEYVTYFSFNLSKSWSLTNGDQITLSFDSSDERLARYGVIVTEKEKELTVSNLATYAADLDSIRDKLTEVAEAARAEVSNWLYSDWEDAVHGFSWTSATDVQIIAEPALYKTVLTTAKSTSNWNQNTLWLVFKATLNDSKLAAPTELYFAVSVSNVAIKADGSLYLTDEDMDKYRAQTSYEELYNSKIVSYNVDIFE